MRGLMDPFMVENCARCGRNHPLEPRELERPAIFGEIEITHWAPCPFTGDPVLIQTVDDKLTDQ